MRIARTGLGSDHTQLASSSIANSFIRRLVEGIDDELTAIADGLPAREGISIVESAWSDFKFGEEVEVGNGESSESELLHELAIIVDIEIARFRNELSRPDVVRTGRQFEVLQAVTMIAEALQGRFSGVVSKHFPSICVPSEGVIRDAPIAKFGVVSPDGADKRYTVVNRREIEGFRSVQRLMRRYREKVRPGTKEKPLSVAVFGPPGSGKSFAVNKIIEEIQQEKAEGEMDIEAVECNLSQYTDVKQLDDQFEVVIKLRAANKIPVVFFDEFDCELREKRLGWLRHFLAPMEDGKYKGRELFNTMFVFAGGTSHSFSAFSQEYRSPSDPQWLDFSMAKGPDFTSRLAGYLNIIGINPVDPEDELYAVRRALFIFSYLTQKSAERIWIDDDLLRAMLRVPMYKNGGRSLRMLLDACRDEDGRLSKSFVPPPQQLNMFVDAKAFMAELYGYSQPDPRFRS